jgi:hypothetical protein
VKFASAPLLDCNFQLVFWPLLRGAYAGDANIARYVSLLNETVRELSCGECFVFRTIDYIGQCPPIAEAKRAKFWCGERSVFSSPPLLL